MLLDEKAAMNGLVNDLRNEINTIEKCKETMLSIFSNRLSIGRGSIKMEEINSLLNDLYIMYAKQQITLDKIRSINDKSYI